MKLGCKPLSSTLALALICLCQPAAAQTVLKFASFLPPQYVLHKPIYEKMANDVARATNGGVEIRIFPSGALGKGPREQYNRALRGVADIAMGVTGYTSSLFPKTLMIELPGVADDTVDGTRKLWNVMDRHLIDEYKGTKVLAAYATNSSIFMTTKVQVRTPADIKGLKIRAPSKIAGEVLKVYGARPVQMPGNKVYTALSTGVIDGALTSAATLIIYKLAEPTKFVTVGIPGMVTSLYIVMNQSAWDELTPSQRKAVADASGRPLSLKAAEVFEGFGKMALQRFASGKDKVLHKISAESRAEFDQLAAKAREQIVRSLEAKGVPARQVLADMVR